MDSFTDVFCQRKEHLPKVDVIMQTVIAEARLRWGMLILGVSKFLNSKDNMLELK